MSFTLTVKRSRSDIF